jgi:hypothetical protein
VKTLYDEFERVQVVQHDKNEREMEARKERQRSRGNALDPTSRETRTQDTERTAGRREDSMKRGGGVRRSS